MTRRAATTDRGVAGRARGRRAAALLAAVLLAATAARAQAQDDERAPRVPSGVTLVFAPAQSVDPAASGAWPGGAASRRGALAAFNAELDFAISEEPRVRSWAPPGEVVDQAGRNPMLKVDPEQLAYRGLMSEDVEDLYEPLHGQLRKLTALLDARLVALPLRVWYAPLDSASAGAAEEDAAAAAAGQPEAPGRAVVQLVVVDTRAGRVLWKGIVGGDPAPAESGASLATLASNLIRTLAPS